MTDERTARSGIRSGRGNRTGIRGGFAKPIGTAAMGLASALTGGAALSQEAMTGEVTLPTIEVLGRAPGEGYTREESQLTRLPTPLVDTPQTIAVVPEEVLEEQKATSVREALRNVSGITISAGEGGRQGDTFNIRGFSAQTDVFRDGVRDAGWYTRNTFNLDGVEVFFGPSSILFGRGSTGGAINLVTKKPEETSFVELTGSLGSAPSGSVQLDVNQAISEDVQIRVNAVGQLAEVADRDHVEENFAGFAPSARFRLGENTTLDLDYLYQRERSIPDYGHPYHEGSPISDSTDVPRDAFYGIPDEDTEEVDAHIATAKVTHEFDGGAELTNTLRLASVERFARPTAPRGLDIVAGTIGRQRFETETDNRLVVNQTDLRGEFMTGFLKHRANIGVELAAEWRDQERHNLNGTPAADLDDPDPDPDLSGVTRTFSSRSETEQRNAAIYFSDQIAFGKYFELLGGARLDVFETDYETTNSAGVTTDLSASDTFVSWRAGLVFHPMPDTSLYAMYGTSVNPSSEAGTLSTGTVSLDPEENDTYEIGAKGDFLDKRLSLSAALFRIDKKNARVPNDDLDPDAPPTILAGRQRVQGFYLGGQGEITERWKLLANYTYMESEIIEHTDPALEGEPLPNTPEHSIALWSTYDLTDRLTLGGGAAYQSETRVSSSNDNTVPAFWRLDAFASYTWQNASLQLNVKNLTDELYYEQYYGGHAVPAEGRTVELTGKIRF